MFVFLTPVLLFLAWLLLLLVSLSAPIIKTIFLFRLAAEASSRLFRSGVTASARFGVWGYCLSAIQVSVVGINRSTDESCSRARLGYTFDSDVADTLNADSILDLISRTTTAALVLHPIAMILAFIALLSSFFMLRRGSNNSGRVPTIVTLAAGYLAAVLATVVFLLDVIAIAIVRNKVRDASDNLTMSWGNAVWITLTSAILLWVAIIGTHCGFFSGKRPAKTTPATY